MSAPRSPSTEASLSSLWLRARVCRRGRPCALHGVGRRDEGSCAALVAPMGVVLGAPVGIVLTSFGVAACTSWGCSMCSPQRSPSVAARKRAAPPASPMALWSSARTSRLASVGVASAVASATAPRSPMAFAESTRRRSRPHAGSTLARRAALSSAHPHRRKTSSSMPPSAARVTELNCASMRSSAYGHDDALQAPTCAANRWPRRKASGSAGGAHRGRNDAVTASAPSWEVAPLVLRVRSCGHVGPSSWRVHGLMRVAIWCR